MLSTSNSGGRSSGSGGLWVVIVIVLILVQQSWGACVSSCGNIGNISYPFRLKDDPSNCGDKNYELECINNKIAALRLFSGEFYVQSINYNNYTIRLVDPNIHNSNCSSLPRHFLYEYNFSAANSDANPLSANQLQSSNSRQILFGDFVYFYCKSAVKEDLYVDTTPCLDPHIYAMSGEMSLGILEIGCRVIAATPASYLRGANLTYRDIYRQLGFGFELSWLKSVCDQQCGSSSCYFDETTGKAQCDTHFCHYIYQTTDQCGELTKFARYTQATLNAILNGIYYAITRRTPTDTIEDPSAPFHPYLIEPIIYGQYGLYSLVAFRVLLGLTFVTALLIFKWRRRHWSMYEDIEHFLQGNDLMPIRYSYKEIKNMSGGFKNKLGEGGFGTVYKGKLRSGHHVAIKMLGKSKANGQDFTSEVATIGRIHHVHVVRLIGFCAEKSKRALVYEYMPNGSLDKFIFSKEGNAPLNYEKIYEISLGVARGITYLHHGCDMQILHFDIKPHNILLDENFIPKVSDFGLARLYPVDDSIITLTAARGTIGYMAPELFYKNIGGVSYKADVYSFGMLLMEMAGRRRNLNQHAEHSSQLYFPLWIYDQFIEEKDIEIEDLTTEERNLAKKMFIVALWCIQLKPIDRPSMNKVVEMLETNDVESLEMPPKPLLYPQETVVEDHGFSSDQTTTTDSIQSSSYASDIIPETSANH